MQSHRSKPRPKRPSQIITCPICSVQFKAHASRIDSLSRPASRLYCSRPCASKGKHFFQPPLEERFWRDVDRREAGEECWDWTGTKDSRGYGVLFEDTKLIKAHRLSWRLHHGPITSEQFVCHHCDNPACVRPSHLFLGNNNDNMQDMIAKGRNCRGSQKCNAVLTEEIVMKARKMYAEGGMTERQVAAALGASFPALEGALSGKSWKHVK